jgi:hypothetical protein
MKTAVDGDLETSNDEIELERRVRRLVILSFELNGAEANPSGSPGDKRRIAWDREFEAAVVQSVIEPVSVRGGAFSGQRVGVSFAFVSARADRALILLVFCLSGHSHIVLVYCHLGKLKAREVLFYTRPIRMSHSETKAFLSLQLKSLLVPSSQPFCLQRTTHLEIYQRSYISHGDNGGMAPTHLPPPPPPLISSFFINLGEQQPWSPTHNPPPPTTTLNHPTQLPNHEDTAFAMTAVPWKPPRALDSDYVEDA